MRSRVAKTTAVHTWSKPSSNICGGSASNCNPSDGREQAKHGKEEHVDGHDRWNGGKLHNSNVGRGLIAFLVAIAGDCDCKNWIFGLVRKESDYGRAGAYLYTS